ncbi:MAG: TRAP transporter small permease [Spirochaetales bacterium]|nr:MAG: TRAP transporter small permease [Spirochaetales bacterium]
MTHKKKYHFDELIAALLLGIMAVLTFANVLNRYLLKSSFAFTEEITVSMFVWITLLGIAIAFRRGTNLKMTNLYDSFPTSLKKLSMILSAFIGIVIFLFLVYNSGREIIKNMTFYHTTSEALGIPTWIYSLGTPLFSIFVLKEIVSSTINAVKKLNGKTPDGTEEV